MLLFEGLSHFNPVSYEDWLPWSWHEKLRFGSFVPIIGTHPFRPPPKAAWHMKPIGQMEHTLEYRVKRAIAEGDMKELSKALNSSFQVDMPITKLNGLTSLALASKLNQEDIVKYLIFRGTKLNARDMLGMTPLMHAVLNAHFDCIKVLVENGASIDQADQFGTTAIDLAKVKGYKAIAMYLQDQMRSRPKPQLMQFSVRLALLKNGQRKQKLLDSMMYTPYRYPIVYPFNNLKGTYLLSLTNQVVSQINND